MRLRSLRSLAAAGGLALLALAPPAWAAPAERNYIACHEFGHSLGLRHSSDTASCLCPNSATSGVLTTHDISELNFHYEIPQ